MKKKYTKGPKEELLPGQIQDTNQMFYRDFSLGYFENKIVSLLEIITDDDKYIRNLKNKSFKIGKLEIKKIEEFDKEEMEVLQNALIFYKNTYKNKAEICDYLLSELKHLKQEDF